MTSSKARPDTKEFCTTDRPYTHTDHTYMHAYKYIHIYTYIYTLKHMYIHTYMYTYNKIPSSKPRAGTTVFCTTDRPYILYIHILTNIYIHTFI